MMRDVDIFVAFLRFAMRTVITGVRSASVFWGLLSFVEEPSFIGPLPNPERPTAEVAWLTTTKEREPSLASLFLLLLFPWSLDVALDRGVGERGQHIPPLLEDVVQ